jgi:hypothetical protein
MGSLDDLQVKLITVPRSFEFVVCFAPMWDESGSIARSYSELIVNQKHRLNYLEMSAVLRRIADLLDAGELREEGAA